MSAITGRILPPRSATFTRFRDSAGSAIDEGIALFFPGPQSYTGEDVIELQGHGGPAVLGMLLQRCLTLGARIAEPGEFTRRAFLNDKLDLAQAEAVADLIDASTEHAARSAARSLTGEFSRCVSELQRKLTELRALMEVALDFPEDDIDVQTHADAQDRLADLRLDLRRTLESARKGSLLREGVRVALLGPPNTGKSSIINLLARQDIAIVTSLPGTTRDLIQQTIEVRGLAVHLIDTAGIREAQDPVEEIGIARTWQAVKSADVVLLISAVTDAVSELDGRAGDPSPPPAQLHVHNKIDLVGMPPRQATIDGQEHVWMSAKTGAGLELLEAAILKSVRAEELSEGVYLARARHLRGLTLAEEALDQANTHFAIPELAAEDLRAAQRALSELTGAFVADDLLGEIFSRFCIGK